MKRRHNWDVLATVYESALDDITIRTLIEEIAIKLTMNPTISTNLICSTSILMWINQQFILSKLNVNSLENWLNVICNILNNGDWNVMDNITKGVWRSQAISIIKLTSGKNITINKPLNKCLKYASEILYLLSNIQNLDKFSLNFTSIPLKATFKELLTSIEGNLKVVDMDYKQSLKNLGLSLNNIRLSSSESSYWINLISRLLLIENENIYKELVILKLQNYL